MEGVRRRVLEKFLGRRIRGRVRVRARFMFRVSGCALGRKIGVWDQFKMMLML